MFRKHLIQPASIALLCGLGIPLLAGCVDGGSASQWNGNSGALGGALTDAVTGSVGSAGAGPGAPVAAPVPAGTAPVAGQAAARPIAPAVAPGSGDGMLGSALRAAVQGAAAPVTAQPALTPIENTAPEPYAPAAVPPASPDAGITHALPAQPSASAAPARQPEVRRESHPSSAPAAPAEPGVERMAAAIDVPSIDADRVAAPHWTVGSEWRYSDGYGLKVTKTDGMRTIFVRLDDPLQWVERRGFLREEGQSSTTHREAVFRTAPPDAGRVLVAGKPLTFRREFLSGGELKVHATSWTLEGRERITVPAGTFDCAIIVMRTRNLVNGWSAFERWWYSPEAQNYVRMEYRYGDSPVGARVLMSYRLAHPTAPRVAMATEIP